MTRLTFGDISADMTEVGYFGYQSFFPSLDFELEFLSGSMLVLVDPISGSRVTLAGTFDLSSEAGLFQSVCRSMAWHTAQGLLLLDWRDLNLALIDIGFSENPDDDLNATILGGADVVTGGLGADTLRGYAGPDVILGGGGSDSLLGESGNDRLVGGIGDDRLEGNDGDDELEGQAGNDHVLGGDGNDLARFFGFLGDFSFSSLDFGKQVTVRAESLASLASDGSDVLAEVESLSFADRTVTVSRPSPTAPAGPPDLLIEVGSGAALLDASWLAGPVSRQAMVWREIDQGSASIKLAFFDEELNRNTPIARLDSAVAVGSYGVSSPCLTQLTDGRFVAAWTAAWQDGYGDGVYGRLISPQGQPVGAEFRLNSRVESNEAVPALAALADGGFVAVWNRGGPGIAGQRFDANGSAVGPEFDVAGAGTGGARVAPLRDGGFVVVWDPVFFGGGIGGAPSAAQGQRYGPDGQPAGVSFTLGVGHGWVLNPEIVALTDGGLVSVWRTTEQVEVQPSIFSTLYGAYAQRLDVNGLVSGDVIEIVPMASQPLYDLHVAALAQGGFNVSWNAEGLWAARFGAGGEILGQGAFLVASQPAFAYLAHPDIAGLADGGFLVSCNVGSGLIAAQLFAADWSATTRMIVEGTAFGDALHGAAGDQALLGGAGDDSLYGGAGNDLIDGGAGIDHASYQDTRVHYRLDPGAYQWAVTALGTPVNGEGTDTLISVERIEFADQGLAFDLEPGQSTGNTVRVIGAAFDTPYLIPEFVGLGLGLFDAGASVLDVCKLVVETPLFAALGGGASDSAFVNTVYQNVVGVLPTQAEFAYYTGLLHSGPGGMTRAELLALATECEANALNVDLAGLSLTGVVFA